MRLTVPLNIYSKPWLVEPNAAMQLLECWEQIKAGAIEWKAGSDGEFPTPKVAMEGVTYAPISSWDMKDFKGFDGASVAVIPIQGPLMKQDFCGSLGTSSLISLIKMADNTPSVKTIIFDTDSPGGTVDGTQALHATIKNAKAHTIAAVSGMAGSACYWSIAGCDEILATSDTDIIGSIGTMISLVDNSKAMEGKGVILRNYYADASKDKNKDFADAKSGDGKALVQNMLNPMNDVFVGSVKESRPSVSEEALTGKVFTSKAAQEMGLIDGVKSMDEIFKSAAPVNASTNYAYGKTKITKPISKSNKMDINQLKAEHPSLYAQVITEGIEEERDRAGAWLEFIDADAKAVVEGIASGKNIGQKQAVELTRKSFYAEMKNGVEAESEATPAKSAATPKEDLGEEKPKSESEAKLEDWAAKLDKALGK